MRILLLFATTQGQTGRIARHLAARFEAAGHEVRLVEAGAGSEPDPAGYDAAVLAGSVHAGKYQRALAEAAARHAAALSARPGLFVSVSLTAAGDDAEERDELDRIARGFVEGAGWQGAEIAQVAGALRFSDYGFFEYWAMLWIARRRQGAISGREDIEFTDWAALDALADDWLRRASTR